MARNWHREGITIASSEDPDGTRYKVDWYPVEFAFKFGEGLSVAIPGGKQTLPVLTDNYVVTKWTAADGEKELGVYDSFKETVNSLEGEED